MKLEDFKNEKAIKDFIKKDKPYFVSVDHLGDVVIVELPEEFKTHNALFDSQEYKDFVSKKQEEERKKREEENGKKSIFDLMKNGSLYLSVCSGTGKSFFGYVEDFVRDYNIKKRKVKINKLLNK